jgi:hypothetical protein
MNFSLIRSSMRELEEGDPDFAVEPRELPGYFIERDTLLSILNSSLTSLK